MKLTKVHHVAVICSDYERSKQFYTDVLGMRLLRKHDYPAFAAQQLKEREQAMMPPFGFQALVRAVARTQEGQGIAAIEVPDRTKSTGQLGRGLAGVEPAVGGPSIKPR